MRNRLENKNTIVGLIIIFALLFFCIGVSIYQLFLPVITLKVDNVTIRQEEKLPEFQVHAEFKGDEELLLDETSSFRVKDLLLQLESGDGYQIEHQVDHKVEGEYKLSIVIEKEMKEKLNIHWNRKVRYRVEAGTVTVLNKYGDWENGRFKYLDGTYSQGWTNLGDETYYFDETGKRVTGGQTIDNAVYYFQKDGKFDKEMNPVNPNRPMIALTFDDGPGMYTMQLLEQLEKYHSKATFFMVGTNVSKHPETLKKMMEMGCDIGNHSTNHADLSALQPEAALNEIQTTNIWIQEIIGQEASLLRPPFGKYNASVQSVAGCPLIMWSMDTRDWESKNAVLVRDYVLNNVRDGEIVLLHDIHESTIQAALELIPILVERGYQLVTISELAKARGIQLQNGSVYKNFVK